MKAYFHISVGLLSSGLLLSGCANRADSLRMLDARADYADQAAMQGLALKEGGLEGFAGSPQPTRTRTRVVPAYLYQTELPTHDYFWGAWISLVVEKEGWILTKPNKMPPTKLLKEQPKQRGTSQKNSKS